MIVKVKMKIEQIIFDYTNNWIGIHSLAQKYHHSDNTIRKILKENGVHIRGHQEACKTRYHIKEDFFDINNQNFNMAYVMGLIASDGMVNSKDNMIKIELKSTDIDILEKINKVLENERPIKTYYRKDKDLETSQIYFYSKKMKDDLAKFHIIPRKTYDVKYNYPDLLNEKYYSAYIRGLFDGDGSILTSGGHISWQIDTSSEKMANWIISYFKQMGLTLNHNYNPKTNVLLHRCITSRKDYLPIIYNLLYKNKEENNPICLDRKFQTFTNFIHEINSHETVHRIGEKIC